MQVPLLFYSLWAPLPGISFIKVSTLRVMESLYASEPFPSPLLRRGILSSFKALLASDIMCTWWGQAVNRNNTVEQADPRSTFSGEQNGPFDATMLY
jgi:hypothetical protein